MTILNALVMGWEADATMRGMLANPVEDTPQMYKYIDLGFTIFFCLELFLRILAGRIWFFMSPTDWGWHWLDVFLVVTSVLSDFARLSYCPCSEGHQKPQLFAQSAENDVVDP